MTKDQYGSSSFSETIEHTEQMNEKQKKAKYRINTADKILEQAKYIDLSQYEIKQNHLIQVKRFLEYQKEELDKTSSKLSLIADIIFNASKSIYHKQAIEKLDEIIKSSNDPSESLISINDRRKFCTEAIIIDAFANCLDSKSDKAHPALKKTNLAIANFITIKQIEELFSKVLPKKEITQPKTIEYNQDTDPDTAKKTVNSLKEQDIDLDTTKKIVKLLEEQDKILEKSETSYRDIVNSVTEIKNQIKSYFSDKTLTPSEEGKFVIKCSIEEQERILRKSRENYQEAIKYVKRNIEEFDPFIEHEKEILTRENSCLTKRRKYREFFRIIRSVYNLKESSYPTLRDLQNNYHNNKTPDERTLRTERLIKEKIKMNHIFEETKNSNITKVSRSQIYKIIDTLKDIQDDTINIAMDRAKLKIKKDVYKNKIKNNIIQALNNVTSILEKSSSDLSPTLTQTESITTRPTETNAD